MCRSRCLPAPQPRHESSIKLICSPSSRRRGPHPWVLAGHGKSALPGGGGRHARLWCPHSRHARRTGHPAESPDVARQICTAFWCEEAYHRGVGTASPAFFGVSPRVPPGDRSGTRGGAPGALGLKCWATGRRAERRRIRNEGLCFPNNPKRSGDVPKAGDTQRHDRYGSET